MYIQPRYVLPWPFAQLSHCHLPLQYILHFLRRVEISFMAQPTSPTPSIPQTIAAFSHSTSLQSSVHWVGDASFKSTSASEASTTHGTEDGVPWEDALLLTIKLNRPASSVGDLQVSELNAGQSKGESIAFGFRPFVARSPEPFPVYPIPMALANLSQLYWFLSVTTPKMLSTLRSTNRHWPRKVKGKKS